MKLGADGCESVAGPDRRAALIEDERGIAVTCREGLGRLVPADLYDIVVPARATEHRRTTVIWGTPGGDAGGRD